MSRPSRSGLETSVSTKANLGVWGFVTKVVSNNARLLSDRRYFDDLVMESLRTNIYRIDRLPEDAAYDAEMVIRDEAGLPTSAALQPARIEAAGDFTRLEKECPDNRYSLFGNLGLYFKFAMAEMEAKGLFSFHASALYRERDNRLLLLVGGPGAGKTVFLLAAVPMGYKVLSTEMTHCRIDDRGVHFYKGAVFDNIRVGNFVVDFPEAIEAFGVTIPDVEDVWAKKISVDMTPVSTREDIITNPKTVVVFPKVELGRGAPVITPVRDPRIQARFLFQNLSEKIASSFLLYDEYPVASFDSPDKAARRGEFVRRLLPHVAEAKNVLTGPRECMKGV